MKKTRKLLALVMAFVMVMAMASTAFAVETVANNTGHDYKAYQIFGGTQGEDATLGDVVWGSGINDTKTTDLMTELKKETAFADCADAAAIAKVLSGKSDNDPVALKFAKIVSKYLSGTATNIASGANSVELLAGYYLLVDQTATSGVQGEVKGLSLLQVTKDDDIVITLKTDKPSVDKEVWDENTDDDKETDEYWGETADHDIGEEFRFRLTATIPADTMTYFDAYQIIFTDEMSDGITFVKIDSVTVNNTAIASGKYVETATNAEDKAGLDWTLTIADVKTAVAGLNTAAEVKVVVTYTAKLNEAAVIGNEDDNKNTVGLEYSNNPNVGGEGEKGKTTKDTVWVFTYKIDATKIDGATKDAEKPTTLAGAEFVLYKIVGDKNLYAVVDSNNKLVKWEEATAGADGKITYPADSVLTTGADGKINVIGLDHGEYKLKETKAPAGYNLLEQDVTVVISAVHEELTEDTAQTDITMTKDGQSANKITVENNKGATLPETGGVGTTIFYAVGGALVLAAIVLLISKKRMASEE